MFKTVRLQKIAKTLLTAVNCMVLLKALKPKAFGLEAEDGQSVKKPLGETVKVKGDDTNIKTSVDGGAVKVELKKRHHCRYCNS